ncbi:MAG: four helix bundle protein [Prochlorotrichaceae cyanobacterium]|jgi:four helix bundle protein
MVLHLHPPANKLRASIKNPLKWVKNCFPPNRKMRPRTIAQQLLRSGTSIGTNIEKSQAAESAADFIHKSFG